jgi:hypothetical protein
LIRTKRVSLEPVSVVGKPQILNFTLILTALLTRSLFTHQYSVVRHYLSSQVEKYDTYLVFIDTET